MVRCIRTHGKMYVLRVMVLCIRSMGLCIRCTVLCIGVFGCVEAAYELDLVICPIKVVLILCSLVSFKLINHLFSFSP